MKENAPYSRVAHVWLPALACLLFSVGAMAGSTPSRGDKYADNGNYTAAIQAFMQAQRQFPHDADIAAKLAKASLRLGQHKQAVKWAKKAVALAPKAVQYQLLLGNAYSAYVSDVSIFSKLHVAHEIRDAYRKGVELEPDNAKAHLSLALYYLIAPGIAGGSDTKGNQQIQLLAKLNPAMANRARARVAAHDKHYKQAEQLLRKAAGAGKDGSAFVALGQFLAFRNRPKDALKAFRKATQVESDGPTAWYQIGKLAAGGKANAKAGIKALTAYLGMAIDWRDGDPSYAWAHYRLAQIQTRLGHVDTARQEYRQALKLNPAFKQAQQALKKLAAS